MDNMMLALTLLIAGFIIVFVVLILLIVIITVYGKLIQAAQRSSDNRKKRKVVKKTEAPAAAENVTAAANVQNSPADGDSDEIPGEIIAVIAAAVDAVYGSKPHKVRSVKRNGAVRSAWGSAGVMSNTRPF